MILGTKGRPCNGGTRISLLSLRNQAIAAWYQRQTLLQSESVSESKVGAVINFRADW